MSFVSGGKHMLRPKLKVKLLQYFTIIVSRKLEWLDGPLREIVTVSVHKHNIITWHVLHRESLNFCLCITWFLDLDDLVGINRGWLCEEPGVSVLWASAQLVHGGKCWAWNQRLITGPDSILTMVTFCYWSFLFSYSKASFANIGIIANFVQFVKNSSFDSIRLVAKTLAILLEYQMK